MSEAFSTAARLTGRPLTGGHKHRTAWPARAAIRPAPNRPEVVNRVTAGLRAIGYAPRNRPPKTVRRAFTADRHPYSLLFVVWLAPKEDTWPAQRIATPVWKAWKGVSA
ncbi:hypothetical protein [Streptomyces sp. ME19-01-6]|uniref:hypothetical protein n=1 Tax=Streptomyces sp. ME19-01-6 TaxID=3028686 RepID=UPI0029A93496|nr:hypothetical protein [Streptomyces sp. ME19-01-6]MDX3231911.1 hypothetical protein [Streptomyces sp. ME19-01-6]